MSIKNAVLKVTKNGVFAAFRHIVTLFNSPKLLKSQENGPVISYKAGRVAKIQEYIWRLAQVALILGVFPTFC